MTENPAPSTSTIVRLVEQSIEEQRDTRARLDAHIEIAKLRFAGVENQLESVRSTATAQFLTLSGELSDLKKHVLQIEEHVGFLTTKTVEHDARFDAVDARFDAHDARFDAVDARFDAVDARFDAVDSRLDEIDGRLDSLTGMVEQIRDAVVSGQGGDGREA